MSAPMIDARQAPREARSCPTSSEAASPPAREGQDLRRGWRSGSPRCGRAPAPSGANGSRVVGEDALAVRLDDVDRRPGAVRRRAQDLDQLGGGVEDDARARRRQRDRVGDVRAVRRPPSPDTAITATCGSPVVASVVVTYSCVPSSTPLTSARPAAPPSSGTVAATSPRRRRRSVTPSDAGHGQLRHRLDRDARPACPSSIAAWSVVRVLVLGSRRRSRPTSRVDVREPVLVRRRLAAQDRGEDSRRGGGVRDVRRAWPR